MFRPTVPISGQGWRPLHTRSKAEANELQTGGTVPFGDVDCHIDAAEKEWNAPRDGASQIREPEASLFKGDTEGLPKPVYIVPQVARLN